MHHWGERFTASGKNVASQLAEIAVRTGWERHPRRTMSVARAIYLGLPSDVQLWVRRREFVPAGAERGVIEDALRWAGGGLEGAARS